MGYYINPKDCSKETWLINNGIRTTEIVIREKAYTNNLVPVCWVDNGDFTAAGIAYDDMECGAFLHPDPRPKLWYLVERAKLIEFCPLLAEVADESK